MHAFGIQSADLNHACILGLRSNLFRIMRNFPTAVGITGRGHVFECRIYVVLIVINLHIGYNFYGGGGLIEYVRGG